MDIEKRYFDFELRIQKENDESSKIVGYAARFNKDSVDLGGFVERLAPGCFKKSLKTSDAVALFNHDQNFVLGRQSAKTLSLNEDNKGLWMEVIPPDTSYARDLMISIDRGDITSQSFGFTVKKDQWEERGKESPLRTILEVDMLADVSVVTWPAYPSTDVALRSLDRARETQQVENKVSYQIVDETIIKLKELKKRLLEI